jgi:type IV pilus assembly protein PilQ
VQNPGLIEMTVRRLPDAVEVVISGVGAMPQLLQSNQGSSWAGRLLVATPGTLRLGPQRLSLPEAGLQMISLEGAGNRFALTVTPTPGFPLGRPVVSADGSNLIVSFAAAPQSGQQSYSRNLSLPGRIPQPELVPPLQPRAVAPPLGDMAVGSMVLRNSGFIDVSGPPVTMTLSNAPVRAVLMKLARIGGYGFVYVNDSSAGSNQGGDGGNKQASQIQEPVSISFRNESYSRALNSTLLAAGLQGKLEGNTLLVGQNVLGRSFGSQLSKVYRLNQVNPSSAEDFLRKLGAQSMVNTTSTRADGPLRTSQYNSDSNYGAGSSTSTSTYNSQSVLASGGGKITTTPQVEAYGASNGPLLGLTVIPDPRLSSITLLGSPTVIAIAENYLKQLDLRQRQVALSVKILDVSLGNNSTVDNSFAFRSGNSFIVNQQGQLVANFGSLKPPSSPEGGLPGLYDGVNGTPTVGTGAYRLPGGSTQLFLTPELASPIPGPGGKAPFYDPRYPARPPFGSYANPGQPGVTKFTPGEPSVPATIQSIITDPTTGQQTFTYSTPTIGTPDELTFANPTAFQYPNNQFFDFVRATIESSSTKVLASPTLILSENSEELESGTGPNALAGLSSQSSSGSSGSSGSTGSSSGGGGSDNNATIGRSKANEAFVTVGEQEIVSYDVQAGQNGAPNTCQPVLGISGLTFGARVSKIDDNGFVTFTMSPSISATVGSEFIPGCGRIKTLAVRRLDTGSARVRDGQTLILTGVLSERDSEIVQKWPILGDIPFIGQFFRNSGGTRTKRELVIMVTPRIIDDNQGGSWGYGYQPGTRDGRRFLGGSSSGSAPSF